MVAMNRTASLAALGAVLALGAGGGARAPLVGGSDTTTTTTVTQRTPSAAVADLKTSGALTVNEIYRRTKQSVVEIRTGDGEGTGFVIDAKGDIVTNQHVVAGADTVTVLFADGTRATGRVVGN